MTNNTSVVPNTITTTPIVADTGVLGQNEARGLEQQFVQPAQLVDQVDPRALLRLQMRVIGGQSKLLGKVDSLVRESATGELTAIIVRHGLLGNKHTSVPAEQVKWVNNDSVVLQLSRTAFQRLPRVTGR